MQKFHRFRISCNAVALVSSSNFFCSSIRFLLPLPSSLSAGAGGGCAAAVADTAGGSVCCSDGNDIGTSDLDRRSSGKRTSRESARRQAREGAQAPFHNSPPTTLNRSPLFRVLGAREHYQTQLRTTNVQSGLVGRARRG